MPEDPGGFSGEAEFVQDVGLLGLLGLSFFTAVLLVGELLLGGDGVLAVDELQRGGVLVLDLVPPESVGGGAPVGEADPAGVVQGAGGPVEGCI